MYKTIPGGWLILILVLTLTAPVMHAVGNGGYWSVHVTPQGVLVNTTLELEEGLNKVSLPSPPLPETIVVSLNEALLPAIYDDEAGVLYVASPLQGNATLSYLAHVLEQGGILSLNLTPNNEAIQLVIDPGVILLDIPPAQDVTIEGETLILQIPPLNTSLTISYVIAEAVKPPQQTNQSQATETTSPVQANTTKQSPTITPTTTQTSTQATTTPTTPSPAPPANTTSPPRETPTAIQEITTTPTTATQNQTIPPTTPPPSTTSSPTQPASTSVEAPPPNTPTTSHQGGTTPLPVIFAVLALATAGAGLLFYARRGKPSPTGSAAPEPVETPPRELDETDRLVLRALERAGGSTTQSRLQTLTGLPKTSLWRRVRRLEQWGYVRVVKEGKVNRVILERPLEEGEETEGQEEGGRGT